MKKGKSSIDIKKEQFTELTIEQMQTVKGGETRFIGDLLGTVF